MSRGRRVALVGATGAVGYALRRLLDEREFPLADAPIFIASERSAGRKLPWREGEVTVQALSPEIFDGVDIAIFSAGGSTSKQWGPVAAERGAVVIDNSSAWRMDDEVPLVVTEVNPQAVGRRPKGIIANPNCTTMVLMVAAKPLHEAFGLTDVVATTYQAAGGAGQSGIRELAEQTQKLLADPDLLGTDGPAALRSVEAEQFSKPIAFNVLPHCGDFADERYTVEEWKLVHESRKILELPALRVSPTCVRVPVFVGHSIAARMTFVELPDRDRAVAALEAAPNLRLVDGVDADGEELAYPSALDGVGIDEVLVGRVRVDLADPQVLNLWVTGDNLLKGAALNAIQIAELLLDES